MKQLSGKVALVTGGGSGIGLESCLRFAQEGADVCVADFNEKAARLTADAIVSAGGKALALHCDVSDEAQVVEMTRRSVATLGRVDVLFTCAGGGSQNDGPVTELDLNEFWRTISVDLFGTLLCCRSVIPEMVRSGGGSIITMSSLRAVSGTKGADAYTASKGGIVSLTRAMALQWAENKIRVNALAPGMVMTERIKAMFDEEHPVIKKMLLGACDPIDVAEMAVFLASDASKRITGTVLHVDSGATAY